MQLSKSILGLWVFIRMQMSGGQLLFSNIGQECELCVEAGKFQQALDSLYEVKEAIYGSDAPGEFARAARVVFRNIYWTKHSEYKHFDAVFNTYFNILVNLGLTEEHSDMRPPSHRRTRDTSIIVISSLTYIGSDQNMSKRLNGGKRGRT